MYYSTLGTFCEIVQSLHFVWRKHCLVFLRTAVKRTRCSFPLYFCSHRTLNFHFCAVHTHCVSPSTLCERGMWARCVWVAYTLSSALFIDKSPLSYFKVQLEGISRFGICKQCCVTVFFLAAFTDFILMIKGFCGYGKYDFFNKKGTVCAVFVAVISFGAGA